MLRHRILDEEDTPLFRSKAVSEELCKKKGSVLLIKNSVTEQ